MNKICLVGNPNCGKTTLFNLLTGKREYTGNRTGVTVEEKTAKYRKNKSVTVIDLPGTYSVKGDAADERVVTEFLKSHDGVIINVADGTNLARNLLLTAELAALNIPMVLAINFCDETAKRGVIYDEKKMQELIGIPVVNISARKNIGVKELMKTATELTERCADEKALKDFCKVRDVREMESFVSQAKRESGIKRGVNFGEKADRILLNGYFGVPIFVAVILAVYFITSKAGGFLGGIVLDLFSKFENVAFGELSHLKETPWLHGLVCGAVIRGVGTVLSFLPQVLVLFTLLSLMEESGYSARVAFLADGITRRFGLTGKSLISFGVSCGCAVSGIMSARSIESESQRKLTVYLSPFMPCSAKVAVFAWLTGVIFNGNAIVFTSFYFVSAFSVAIFGAILVRNKRFTGQGYFIMEIPRLRVPHLKSVAGAITEKATDFILKAGSTIFLVSVCVWFLQNFSIHGYTTDITNSFLYYIGSGIKYIFMPLGFGTWQAAVAVISGIFAREAVIETLAVLSADGAGVFSGARAAYSFMTFILLMPPCVAALAVARRELGGRKSFVNMILFQTAAAYSVALTVNAVWYFAENNLIAFLSLTFIGIGVIICVKVLRRSRCVQCARCERYGKCERKVARAVRGEKV